MDRYELTPMQEGILADCLSTEGANLYHSQRAFRLDVELDEERFVRAWTLVVDRHDACRTAVSYDAGVAAEQIVHDRVELDWQVVDFTGTEPDEWEPLVARYLEQDRRQPLDLGRAPVMRFRLLRMRSDLHYFVWTHHHLLLDGWSARSLLTEVSGEYESGPREPEASGPADRIQFGDYVRWLRDQDFDEAEAYWREMFAEPGGGGLGSGATRGVSIASARTEPVVLDDEVTATLHRIAREYRVTLSALVYGAWAVVLRAYSGQDVVTFGSVVSGRGAELDGIDDAIGMFINVLPIRLRCAGERSIMDQVRELQLAILEVQQFDSTPLRDIQTWAETRSTGVLFETVLSTGGLSSFGVPERADLFCEEVGSEEPPSYPMMVGVTTTDPLRINMAYDPALFDSGYARSVAQTYRHALESIAAEPETLVRDLALVAEHQLASGLDSWHGPSAPKPAFASVHELFLDRAERAPDAIAVTTAEEKVGYAELRDRVLAVAARLRSEGLEPEERVGLCASRSVDMVVGFLGILAAGGVVVPLDPEYPAERIAYLAKDSGIRRVLAQQGTAALLAQTPVELVWLDVPSSTPLPADASPLVPVRPDELAYVAYTSGSTGRPKGTMISHGSFGNLLTYVRDDLNIGPGDRVLQSLPLSFDVGICEVLQSLCLGATLCLAPAGSQAGDGLVQLLRQHGITVATAPVSVLAATESDNLPELRMVITGGDKLAPEVGKRWASGRRVVNQYGVSEGTVVSLAGDCGPDDEPMTIGLPIVNTTALVLNDALRPVPAGAPGELYLAGAGLQRGYLGRPGLTGERMLPNPCAELAGERMYRTGDRVRQFPDGRLEYLGRVDEQLNIRGNRIEPGEVESALLADPQVDEAVVLVADGDLRGYVRSTAEIDDRAIIERLRTLLPSTMVPVSVHRVPQWPTLPSGKIDRDAIPAQVPDAVVAPAVVVEPRTELERQLTEVFAGVLGVDRVGVNQNFFELGGDSILAIQVVSRAAQRGLTVATRQVFRHQTVEELALVTQDAQPAPAVPVEAEDGSGRLSPMQHWFVELGLRRPDETYQWSKIDLSPELGPEQIEAALNEVLRRHSALRTRFLREGDSWRSAPAESFVPVRLRRMRTDDLSDEEETSLETREIAALGRALDLQSGEVIGCELLERPGVRSRLLLVAHQIVVDGVSWRIIADELDQACRQLSSGQTIDLGQTPMTFDGWVARLVRYAGSEELLDQSTLWREIVSTGSGPLPSDHELGPNTEESARVVSVELDEEETRNLLQGGGADGLAGTAHEVLLATLGRVLSDWSGQRSVQVEIETHGREQITDDVDLSRTVGWFTATYPLALPSGDGDLGGALAELRTLLDRIPHHGLGYGLLRYLTPNGAELAHRSQVGFNYLGQWRSGQDADRRLARMVGALGAGAAPTTERSHAFEVGASVVRERLRLYWEYSSNLHSEQTVEALVRRQVGLLRQLCRRRSGASLSPGPADFPASGLDQRGIDQVLSTVPDAQDIYPLSPLQNGILVHSVLHPGMYCHQFHLRLRGEIDPDALEATWRSSVARNPALRTAILHDALDEPVQVVVRDPAILVRHEDCRERSPEEARQRVDELTAAEHEAGIDLTAGAPLRLVFVRESDDSMLVVITAHHIMLDRWSFDLVLADLIAGYNGLVRGEPFTPTPRRPYREFIDWLSRQDMAAAREHWMTTLSGVQPCTALPGADSRTPAGIRLADSDASGTAHRQLKLDVEATDALKALARRAGVTLNTVVQAAWALLLGGSGGGTDIVFGATTSGRPPDLSGAQEMVGLFINTLPVRIRMNPAESVITWLQEIQDQQVESRHYDFAPLHEIQRWAGVTDNRPLFRTMLAFENQGGGDPDSQGPSVVQVQTFQRRAGLNCPLALAVEPDRALLATLLYDQDLLADEAIADVGERLHALLSRLGSDEPATVGTLLELATAVRTNESPADDPADRDGEESAGDQEVAGRPDPTDPVGRAHSDAAPMSRAELELMDIWEGVLTDRPKDVETNFYEGGGHSLLALRFADRANKLFGTEVPLIDLLREPTIRAMARLLTGEETAEGGRQALVPIRTDGDGPILFGVHAGDGRVRCYRRLAQVLDEDQPVYGLQDAWANEGEWPWSSLQEMAAAYITEIERVEPTGPYHLIGYSFGGWLAFEIARQLREKGREVANLAVVDATVPGALGVGSDDEDLAYLAVFLQDLMEDDKLTRAELERELVPTENQSSLDRLVTKMWPDSAQEQRAARSWLEQALRMFRREIALSRDYRIPDKYDGSIQLFRAEERDEGLMTVDREIEEDPAVGWGRVSREVEVVWLPGNHATAMTGRSLDLIADRLTEKLRNQ